MRTFIQTISFPSRNIAKVMAATALLTGVAGFVSSARADNIHWSIGLGSPGVTIGMTNARPLPMHSPGKWRTAPLRLWASLRCCRADTA